MYCKMKKPQSKAAKLLQQDFLNWFMLVSDIIILNLSRIC